MNDRIRELAEQADLYARSDNSSMLFENYQKRYTEKFAELIVRECSQMVHNSHPDDLPFVGGKMLTHFGVEE